MNNNKGFTLVELIAAIVLLSLVVGITSFSIIGIINRNKEENYNLLIKNINSAAETYYQECRYSNNDMINCNKIENDEYMVSLGDLVNYGFLKGNEKIKEGTEKDKYTIVNPLDKTNISNCKITVKFVNSKVEVNIPTSDVCPSNNK